MLKSQKQTSQLLLSKSKILDKQELLSDIRLAQSNQLEDKQVFSMTHATTFDKLTPSKSLALRKPPIKEVGYE